MTLTRFALIAFVSCVTLAAQVASADLRYGPAYDPANRIEDLACALQNEFRSAYQDTRFDGSLVGIASAMESKSQAILRLARTGRDQSAAILAIAGEIRRLAITGQQRLSQVEADLVRGRGVVQCNPAHARQMLGEIDRLAAYITQVTVGRPQAFGGLHHGHNHGPHLGSNPGSQFGNRYNSGYRGGHGSQFGEDFGPAYDDRFVQPAQRVLPVAPQLNVPVQPNQGGLSIGGRGWGIQLGR